MWTSSYDVKQCIYSISRTFNIQIHATRDKPISYMTRKKEKKAQGGQSHNTLPISPCMYIYLYTQSSLQHNNSRSCFNVWQLFSCWLCKWRGWCSHVHKVFKTAASNPQSAKVNETRERRDMPNRSLNADHHVMALGQTQREFASCDMPIAEL